MLCCAVNMSLCIVEVAEWCVCFMQRESWRVQMIEQKQTATTNLLHSFSKILGSNDSYVHRTQWLVQYSSTEISPSFAGVRW